MSTITRTSGHVALPTRPDCDRVDAVFGAAVLLAAVLVLIAKLAGLF